LGRPNPPGFAQLFFELPLLLRTKLCDGPHSDRGFMYRGNPRLAHNAVAPLPVSFMMFMISFLSTIICISFFDISLFNMLYRYSICRKCAFSPTIACKIATTGTNTHNPGIKWYRSYFSRWFSHRDHASQVLSCSFKPAAPCGQEPRAPKIGTPAQQNRYPQPHKAAWPLSWGFTSAT